MRNNQPKGQLYNRLNQALCKTTFRKTEEYNANKLASKQANRLFFELAQLFIRKAEDDELHKFYLSWHSSHLYKEHGGLYCQVISDVFRVINKLN